MICDLDIAVICRVTKIIETLASTSGKTPNFAVNVSGQSLENPRFVDSISRIFERHHRVRKNIALEITESSLIQNLESTNEIIQDLRKAGHAVCLDDFGAGSSAFQYLRVLEVDIVKIDGVYVRDATKSATGKALLKSMVGLCHELGIAVVAEMVESEEPVRLLRECRVKFGQGYLFGKPSPDLDSIN